MDRYVGGWKTGEYGHLNEIQKHYKVFLELQLKFAITFNCTAPLSCKTLTKIIGEMFISLDTVTKGIHFHSQSHSPIPKQQYMGQVLLPLHQWSLSLYKWECEICTYIMTDEQKTPYLEV